MADPAYKHNASVMDSKQIPTNSIKNVFKDTILKWTTPTNAAEGNL